MTKLKKYLRRAEVLAYLSIAASTQRRWEKLHGFPEGIAFGPRTILWDKAAIDAWMRKRQEEPRVKPPQPEGFKPGFKPRLKLEERVGV